MRNSSGAGSGCVDLLSCGSAVLGQAASAVQQTVDFWSDPWGNTFKSLQSAAHDLAVSVLPSVTRATLPDLNAGWFVQAYGVAFALAIFMAVVLLIPQFLRTARGVQSGRELAESVGLFFPLFLVGAMFGPPVGALLVNFFDSLSDAIIRWGIDSSSDSITGQLQSMLTANDTAGIAGGAPVGVLLMVAMICGLLLVVVMLVVQLVTLYFTGVLLPLGLVWIIDPGRRRFGSKIVTIWVGILASHPLLFFLLSIAYLMVADSSGAFAGGGATLQKTVQLVVSVLALFMAGLTPFVLTKLAPVIPVGGAGTGPQAALPSIGALNLTEADDEVSSGSPRGGAGSAGRRWGSGSSGTGETSGPQSISDAATSQDAPAASGGIAPSTAGVGDGSSSALVGAPAGAPPAGRAAAAGTGPAVAGSAGTAAGGSAVGAEEAAGAAVAVGAGESATGVGVALGVVTIAAGAAIGAAGLAKRGVDRAREDVDALGGHVVAPVEDHERASSEVGR